MNEDEEAFERRSRELLQAGVDGLDGRIRSRLTQARFAALEAARKNRFGFAWQSWIPAGGVAAAALLAVLLWNARPADQPGTQMAGVQAAGAASSMDDLELLVASESFELLEDLEFYEWLESAPGSGDANVG